MVEPLVVCGDHSKRDIFPLHVFLISGFTRQFSKYFLTVLDSPFFGEGVLDVLV